MPYCAVMTCKNKSGSHNLTRGGISYHRFPNDPGTRAKWISATGKQNWSPSKTATICSIHFEPYDFVKKEGVRHYLHPVATPTRYICTFPNNINLISSVPSQSLKFSETTWQDESEQDGNMTPERTINDRIDSIEVEITPENSIFVNPQAPQQNLSDTVMKTHSSSFPSTREEDKRIMELMEAKIKEQDIMIRKLKVRNYRLKKRLFSLKSMES